MNSPPNIVLVTADSVRADYCGFLNPEVNTTPSLDVMASEGVTFLNAVSPGPRTPSSIPEIMTGENLPNDHVDPSDWEERIARIREHMSRVRTMPEYLQAEGYSTVAFTSNPWTGTYTSFDKGFDVFRKNGKRSMMDLNVFADTILEPISETFDQWWNRFIWRPVNGIGSFARWPQFIDEIIDTVHRIEQPYFLWVFLLDSHSPYLIPRRDRNESSAWDMVYTQLRANSIFKDNVVGETSSHRNSLPPKTRNRLRGMYRDSIRSVDRFVSLLFDEIQGDDPLFVFHSDHGEAFNEHGTYGHQRELYEENVHVPLLVYNSGSSGIVEEVVSLRDIREMIHSYVSDDVPFVDRRWHSDHAVLRTEDNSKYGIRTDRWKFIQTGRDTELYDLGKDPTENNSVANDHPSKVAKFQEVLDRYVEALPRRDGYGRQSIGSEAETRLSDLGYI